MKELPEGVQEYKKQEMRIEKMSKNVLDIDKAVKIMKWKRNKKAIVGLIEDGCYDEEVDFGKDFKKIDVSSTWATPSLKIKTLLGEEIIPCSKRVVEEYKQPVPQKVKVTNFLTGVEQEYEYDYRRDGVLCLDIPLSCAYRFNKVKGRYEMLCPHICPNTCKCQKQWYKKKRKG